MQQSRVKIAILSQRWKISAKNSIWINFFVGNGNIVKTLIKNGTNTNYTDSDGDSALMKVAAQGKMSWKTVKPPCAFWKSQFNVTGNINMMKLLIENDADVNAVNNDNQSALIKAIAEGNLFLLIW